MATACSAFENSTGYNPAGRRRKPTKRGSRVAEITRGRVEAREGSRGGLGGVRVPVRVGWGDYEDGDADGVLWEVMVRVDVFEGGMGCGLVLSRNGV